MTNPVKFLLGMLIASLVLGVIYYFIPANKSSEKVNIYSYIEANDVKLVKFDNAIFNKKLEDIEIEKYEWFQEALLAGTTLNTVLNIYLNLPENSIDLDSEFLLAKNSEGRTKVLFAVSDWMVLKTYFTDNENFTAVEGQENAFYSEPSKGIFSFNESVLRYAEGQEFLPLVISTEPNHFDQKNIEFLKKDEAIYSILSQNWDGGIYYKKVLIEDGSIIIITEPFDTNKRTKNEKISILKNQNQGKISSFNGQFENDSLVPGYAIGMIQDIAKTLSLNADSILNYWDGGIDFEIKSIDTASNEYITFEYDDNFEKVEKKVIKEEVFVNFYLLLEDRNKDLFAYLEKKNKFAGEFGSYTLAGMPFTTYVKTNDDGVFISSTRRAAKDLDKSNGLFNLNIDDYIAFEKAMKILNWNSVLEGPENLNGFRSIAIQGELKDKLPFYQVQMSFDKDSFKELWNETMTVTGF